MGFLSQSGQLGLKRQVSKGAFLAPGAASPNNGVFLRFTSGSLGGTRSLLIPDPEIGGNRDIPDAALGPISFAGDFNAYARMESLATLLFGALGSTVDSGTATSGYTHTITPADALPWLSAEEKVGNGYDVFNYTDVKVNTLHLEAAADGYLMTTFGLVGLNQIAGATATATPNFDVSPLILGSKITITYNGVQLPAKSFSMDVNNNLETNDFRLGSLFLGDIAEKRREITLGATIRPNDSGLWRTAMYGSSAATVAQGGTAVKQPVVVNITSYEDIPGATAGIKYNLQITIPNATIAPFSLSPSGDDVLQHDLDIRALRPAPGTPILTAAIKNSTALVL